MKLISKYRSWIVGVALIVFMATMPFSPLEIPGIFPGPASSAGTLQVLALALLIGSLALSYHLLLGVAGLLSFGHALYFAIGTYGLGILLRETDLSLLPAMLIVFVIGIAVAHILGKISLQVSGIAFAMVTLAFAQAGSVLIRRNSQITNGEEGLPLNTTNVPSFLVGVINTQNLFWLALVIAIVSFLLVTWFEMSRAGHVVAATRENELRVRVLGIRPKKVKILAVVSAGVIATVAGMVYFVLQSTASPANISADLTLTLLVIVVLGGVGSRWGALIGGVIYMLLDQRLTAIARTPEIRELPDILRIPLSEPLFILGTLFILVVLFLPGGFAGFAKRIRQPRVKGD